MDYATGEEPVNTLDNIPDEILQIDFLELYSNLLDVNPNADFVDVYNTIVKKFPTDAVINDVTNYLLIKTNTTYGHEKNLVDVIVIFHVYAIIKKNPQQMSDVGSKLRTKIIENWNKFIDSLNDIPD